MERKYLNPPTLLQPRGYTHVVTVEGGGKMVFISGQSRWTRTESWSDRAI